MRLKTTLNGKTFQFRDIKDVLAKANEPKSGDRFQGIAAESVTERVAAKIVLSELTVGDLTENPIIPYELDEVTRVNIDGLNRHQYEAKKNMTIGQLREWILSHKTTQEDLIRSSRAFTGEVAAAVAKIMSAMDLVYGARKINVVTRCNTAIGQRGTLSFRCQTNSTTDDPETIVMGLMEGVSYGSGDACLGINPVEDNVESTRRIADGVYNFMSKNEIPTQVVVLSHMTTQMKAMEQGAPLSMIFQSIAGTQAANDNFGVNRKLVEEAYILAKQRGTSVGPNLLYFETGQGSEVSIGADLGVDEMTLEARTYGFGRYFNPFMVNNVSGFIGPETLYDGKEMIRANLEDHFMGKLMGLPMGMAPCFTNHTSITQDDQEMATMLLNTAGANFYMGVPVGDDVMLAYQDTSFHNDAALRELSRRKPAPEFHKWMMKRGLMDENGVLTELAGDGSIFLK
ncbi:ethanolamine ammonia-lyase subunit EutB [Brevibacillus daliensis]|uniref:ethanolamine ammonia-lyase subunit EutB n=1 Tax=Brevibacillus daliensis TaxID=2892995 RepID=UPI001E316458|nr:ethanolamine ammonia-lyase subunit EutB [Brevibacillus daliensis]